MSNANYTLMPFPMRKPMKKRNRRKSKQKIHGYVERGDSGQGLRSRRNTDTRKTETEVLRRGVSGKKLQSLGQNRDYRSALEK